MTNYPDIAETKQLLFERLETLDAKRDILKAKELKQLFAAIKDKSSDEKASYGQAVNQLRLELEEVVELAENETETVEPIDLTAPWDAGTGPVSLLPTEQGTTHPLTQEIKRLSDIFERMGFAIETSREIDDQFHMFETLNFPKDHPARDDYDTFMTTQTDAAGDPFIAPAHTSTMQHRILKKYKSNLSVDEPIAAVVPDRVFRNEDLDARHEHTFYQHEGVYVSKGVNAGMLVATLKTFLEAYYEKELNVQINPFYFPFTEPSFEFSLSCPFCEGRDNLCKVCSGEGWIELLGCGMIHPNVLKTADIDPEIYTGFAWGGGIDRLVMMKYGIEDIRHFESGKLDFLRQF